MLQLALLLEETPRNGIKSSVRLQDLEERYAVTEIHRTLTPDNPFGYQTNVELINARIQAMKNIASAANVCLLAQVGN